MELRFYPFIVINYSPILVSNSEFLIFLLSFSPDHIHYFCLAGRIFLHFHFFLISLHSSILYCSSWCIVYYYWPMCFPHQNTKVRFKGYIWSVHLMKEELYFLISVQHLSIYNKKHKKHKVFFFKITKIIYFPHPQTEQIPEWIWSSVGHMGHLVPREAFERAHNKTVFSLSHLRICNKNHFFSEPVVSISDVLIPLSEGTGWLSWHDSVARICVQHR